jgi:DNA-binding MarR family transcriptional regulator
MELTRQSEKAPALRDLPSRLLAQTAALVGRAVTEVLDAEGAHRHQFAVLATLEAFGASSQAELCRRTDLDRSDMNTIVNALEADGSVTRAVDADNRRRNIVAMTARGRQRFAQLKARLEEAQDRVLAPLSLAERDELVRLLQVLHDHLAPGRREADGPITSPAARSHSA